MLALRHRGIGKALFKVMDGLTIQYTNYRIDNFTSLSRQEKYGTIPNPPIKVHETTLKCEWGDELTMRKCYADNWPPRGWRQIPPGEGWDPGLAPGRARGAVTALQCVPLLHVPA